MVVPPEQPAVAVPVASGKLAAINPAELWGAAGSLSLGGMILATGIPSRLGLTPEETGAILALVFTLAAIVRGTFQAWSTGKRGRELGAVAAATAHAAITPELVAQLQPLLERILDDRDRRQAARLGELVSSSDAPLASGVTRDLPPTVPPRGPAT